MSGEYQPDRLVKYSILMPEDLSKLPLQGWAHMLRTQETDLYTASNERWVVCRPIRVNCIEDNWVVIARKRHRYELSVVSIKSDQRRVIWKLNEIILVGVTRSDSHLFTKFRDRLHRPYPFHERVAGTGLARKAQMVHVFAQNSSLIIKNNYARCFHLL